MLFSIMYNQILSGNVSSMKLSIFHFWGKWKGSEVNCETKIRITQLITKAPLCQAAVHCFYIVSSFLRVFKIPFLPLFSAIYKCLVKGDLEMHEWLNAFSFSASESSICFCVFHAFSIHSKDTFGVYV